MECHHCQAANSEGKKYCGDCGSQLSAPSLRQEIEAALKQLLKDQKVVEIELTEAIVNRLTGWAKTLAYFIGIPLVLLGGALGFLGVKTLIDFSTLSKEAASRVAEFEKQSKSLTTQIGEFRKKAEDLKTGFADIDKQLVETRALSSRVESLSTEVRQIRERVGFEKSSALTPGVQKEIESIFYEFQAYLEKIGYKTKEGIIKIHVDPEAKSNAWYDGQRVVLAEKAPTDRHALLYTYMMHVLEVTKPGGFKRSLNNKTVGSVASGLGDYFSASFLNDPRISSVLAKEIGLKQQYLRNLENQRRFDDHSANGWNEVHSRGETWGGAFWEIRGLLGQETADRLLFRAWVEWELAGDADASFAWKLIGLSPPGDIVRDVFFRRGLKVR
jgi:hypothetical protein